MYFWRNHQNIQKIPASAFIIDELGFKFLNLLYVQPPLGEGKNASENLDLAVWSNNKYIDNDDIKIFIKVFFQKAFSISQQTKDYYINEMCRRIDNNGEIQLRDIIPK